MVTVGTLLLVLAIVLGFYVAWNIGANDVANAMGTSVGSGALTLRRAVVLAAILEFAGSVLLGSHVSQTIESGVIDPGLYAADPRPYVLGMLGALLAVGVWLQIASYFAWPVSTTHTIVGAIAGFGLVSMGVDAVEWGAMIAIAASWIISPIMGAAVSFLVFTQIRRYILYKQSPLAAAKRVTPILVFLVFCIFSLVLLFQDTALTTHLNFWEALGLAILIGLLAAILTILLVKRVGRTKQEHDPSHYEVLKSESHRVESLFAHLQVLSACFMAFAHGSNDVANAMGPMAGIVRVLQTGIVTKGASIPIWVLAWGGLGIVLGLATWGWRVIATIGKKITELTPSRGFVAEFSAATTVVVASRLGLPISTTHTLVGAVLGVGLARGIGALNLNVVRDIVISWVITVPAGALLSIIFYHLLNLLFR